MAHPAGNAQRILHLLRNGPQTAQRLARQLDLDVSSARRHLDGFEQGGLVAFDDQVDGPGRPRRFYRLTERGWESFPRDYALLLGAMTAKLQQRVGRAAILEAYAAIADDLAATIPTHAPVTRRLEALRRLYQDLGFDVTLETEGRQTTLVQRNCPFLKAAKDDPEGLCDSLDEGIIRRVLPEATVELGQCMATGGNLCRHRITMKSQPAAT